MDEQTFLDQLLTSPANDTALVYADWLEEHGQADRARLIRAELRAEACDYSEEWREAEAEKGRLTKRCTEAFGPLCAKFRFDWSRGLATATVVKPRLAEGDLRGLGRFPHLTTLRGFEQLAVARLAELAECPNIVCLQFTNQKAISAKHWQALAKLPHLRRLSLDGSTGGGPGVSDDDMPHVAALAGLRGLDMRQARITDTGVRHLAGLQALEVLDLSQTEIGDEGLAFLPSLTRLRVLRLARTAITGNTVARLRALPALEELDIGGTQVEDPVRAVLPLKGLRVLGLSELEAVNDESLPELLALPHLRELDLLKADVTRFRLAQLLPRTPWKKVHLGIRSNHDYAESRELGAFTEFCQGNGVEVEVTETEWE
jgi:uncharacterized protein (TIGR02996 family)